MTTVVTRMRAAWAAYYDTMTEMGVDMESTVLLELGREGKHVYVATQLHSEGNDPLPGLGTPCNATTMALLLEAALGTALLIKVSKP